MKTFCSRCGVELEPGIARCPLCSRPVTGQEDALPPMGQSFPDPAIPESMGLERVMAVRGRILMVISFCLAIPAGVCILVDSLYTGMTWSHWVVSSLALLWGLCFLILAFLRMPLTAFLSGMLSLALYLVVMDGYEDKAIWAVPMAIPILACVSGVVLAVWIGIHFTRGKPGFEWAVALSGAVLTCVGVELVIRAWMGLPAGLSWSLVVLAALVPLVVLAVVLQILMVTSMNFRRFFHW